ncbi:MAG: selenite/tellurite reduction operon rhodanese-like protein ExtH [Desulfuromonadaceae bacterium]|nr:selenite/tellurite reduction operon rhodanese-like protein ExtH [Desulfuromonadaceae bacterium]
MSEKMMKKSKGLIAVLLGTVMIAALTIWGCGTSSYDNPSDQVVTTKTATALITAADLKGWMDAGLVNRAGGYDRVVILDVTANATDGTNKYNSVGHIPGAYLVSGGNGYFQATRAEGPLSVTGSMVCTGDVMDTLIQNAGIDANTTIVLTTSSGSALDLTRPYATFRYWGFPKNRIKVLQGSNPAWTAAGYALTSQPTVVQKSTYGVSQGQCNVNADMRVSLSEMIATVKGIVDTNNAGKVYILDTVRPAPPTGGIFKTGDLITSGTYTPFDGFVKGSYGFILSNMITGTTFKTAEEIKTFVSGAFYGDGATSTTTIGDANRDAAKTFVAMCRAGNNASQAYFVLDGIAYYNSSVDVKWYDGSLGQWNLMASKDHLAVNGANAGGQLAVGSIWDTTSLMDSLTWNLDRSLTIVNYASRVYGVEPSFAEGNQIETADKAYRSVVVSPSGGAAAGGGGGC